MGMLCDYDVIECDCDCSRLRLTSDGMKENCIDGHYVVLRASSGFALGLPIGSILFVCSFYFACFLPSRPLAFYLNRIHLFSLIVLRHGHNLSAWRTATAGSTPSALGMHL